MAAVPDVTITAGVPTGGTGTVSTLDKFDGAAGAPATRAVTVQGIGSGTPVPVSVATIPSHAVTVASGGVASGAIASGAVASGAVASGAFASGSIASGAMVDLGAIADAAVTAGATGSLSAKLRSISRDIVANIVLAAGSAIIGKVGVDQTTPGTTNAVAISHIGSTAVATGSGAMSAGVIRTALATDSPGVIATAAPGTLSAAGPSVTAVNPSNYETVAASQTAQSLGATGATGDFINGILVTPANLNPGNVLLLDNATSITVFTGGTASVSNLVPFFIPLGMTSVSGAWKITTGASVSCIGIGKFT